MAKPVMRLSISNKDKTDRTYKDYKGNDKSGKYQSVGAVFKNEEGRLWIAVDKKFTVDPDKHWFNIFVNEDSDEEAPASKKPSSSKSAGKKYTKKAPPPPPEDEDESEDSDDGEDPFAD